MWHLTDCHMNPKLKKLERIYLTCMTILVALAIVSCSGQDFGFLQPTPEDLCKCLPIEPDIADYRHAAKHVPIPNVVAQEVSVETILTWSQDIFIPPDAPRFGRELEVFHIANAFLQNASVNALDCDVSMEISQTADKSSSRMIVETPVDSEYCGARQKLQAQLKQHGFRLDSQHGGELPQALQVDVVGMAFEDFEHDRGPVATLWELHPAIVTLHQESTPQLPPEGPARARFNDVKQVSCAGCSSRKLGITIIDVVGSRQGGSVSAMAIYGNQPIALEGASQTTKRAARLVPACAAPVKLLLAYSATAAILNT